METFLSSEGKVKISDTWNRRVTVMKGEPPIQLTILIIIKPRESDMNVQVPGILELPVNGKVVSQSIE